MSKKTSIVSLLLCVCVSFGVLMGFSACSNSEETREVAQMMGEAIEKIEAVNEMVLFSEEGSEEVSEDVAPATTHFSKNKVAFASQSTVTLPSDAAFRKMHAWEAVSRQIQVKYPYVSIDYLLQTAVDGKKHKKKFEVDKVFYGPARKTINEDLNALFEDPSIPDPMLAIDVQKEEDGFSFEVDWDWRNDYLQANYPMQNLVVMCNGKVEYFKNEKKIKRILMNWYLEHGCRDFMTSIMDFEKNEFYYIEAYNRYSSSTESTVDNFNDGTLTTDKLIAYNYEGLIAIKSNISDDPKEINLQAYAYWDSDTSSVSNSTYVVGEDYYGFCEVYEEAYNAIRSTGFKCRDASNPLSTKSGTKIDYMDYAMTYALNRSSIVTIGNEVQFLYLTEKELLKTFQELSKQVDGDEKLLAVIDGAKNSLDNLNGPYVGDLGTYNGKQYAIEYAFLGGYSHATFNYKCAKFHYVLTDGETSISFSYKKKKPVIEEVASYKGLEFETINDESCMARCVDKTMEEVTIPQTYWGLPVTRIEGFNDCKNLKKVTILGQLEYLGYDAFANCSSLEEIVLPESLKTIRDNAFYDCTSLKTIVLPDNVTSISGFAFYRCSSLTSVTLGANVTAIGWNAFEGCSNLKSVTIGENVQSIGLNAFYGCEKLYEVINHSQYITVEIGSYDHGYVAWYAIKAVNPGEEDIPFVYGDENGLLTITYGEEKILYAVETENRFVEVPEGVTTIDTRAFLNKQQLRSVTFPSTLKTVPYDCFSGCYNLLEVLNKSETLVLTDAMIGISDVEISNYSEGDDCTSKIKEENGLLCLGDTLVYCEPKEELNIPIWVTKSREDAFWDCKSVTVSVQCAAELYLGRDWEKLEKVTITGGTKIIPEGEEGSFRDCASLKEIVISETVEEIGSYAFFGCSSLEKVDLGKVKFIAYGAFGYCSSLKEIVIPETIEKIASHAFYDCVVLEKVHIQGAENLCIEENVFSGCRALKQIVIPASVQELSREAFDNCGDVKGLSIIITNAPDEYKDITVEPREKVVYYDGTEADWGRYAYCNLYCAFLQGNKVYFLSEERQDESDKYWHIQDGKIVIW